MNLDQTFDFQLRTRTRFGYGVFNKLPDILQELGFSSAGIVIDAAVYKNEKVRQTLDACAGKVGTVVHVYKLKGEPTYDYLDEAKVEFIAAGKSKVDCFIGIGGGSCIDFAKGLATLVNNPGPAIQYRGFPKGINPSVPVIAIPTTSGTGSELAFNAVFIETREKKKLGINTENNYPVMAILDPGLTLSCPRSVTVSSGLDAMVHALESFVSKRSNVMTRMFSREAFGLIINSLLKAVEHPDDVEARAKMMLGAYWAMACLSNASSGPTGALSYLLGARYDVPHGIAGGVFIGRVTRINHDSGYHDYAELYNVIDGVPSGDGLSREQKSRAVVEKIEALLEKLAVPRHLKVFGVKPEDYDVFYQHATEIYKGAFDLNAVDISPDQKKALLKEMIQ